MWKLENLQFINLEKTHIQIIQIISKNHLAKKSPTEQFEPKSQKDITEEDLQVAHKHI